jgi:hypothetical protein
MLSEFLRQYFQNLLDIDERNIPRSSEEGLQTESRAELTQSE